ncbi:MAG: hypothetical protein K8R90_04210 [Candidatus Cloacimonetes bacterium]|nr:hypothetical protein [Candidatus Cloacimonadota bacterium]
MRLAFLSTLLFLMATLSALRLNVLVHPMLSDSLVSAGDSLLALVADDSAPLLCAGRTLARDVRADTTLTPAAADSLVLAALRRAGCLWSAPSDYHWLVRSDVITACNIATAWGTPAFIVLQGDSLRLGVAALYSPDTAVRYPPGPQARYLFDIPTLLPDVVDSLRTRCDLVLLLTNLPRHVLRPLLATLIVDGIVSFDYMASRSSDLDGVPYFSAAAPTMWTLWTENTDGRTVLRGERLEP